MRFHRTLFALLLSLSALAPAWAANIEQSMSPEEFKAAGLDKLNADELQRLNAWLQGRDAAAMQVAPAAAVAPAAQVASTPQPAAPPIKAQYRKNDPELQAAGPAVVELVESRIVGYFEGWRKGTIFKLENGQHWRVTDDRRFESPSIDSPPVRIKAAMMSSWLLQVGDYNRKARVQRVK